MKKNFRNWIFSALKSVGCISVQFSIIWHQRHCNYLHIRSVFLWWIINMSGHHSFIITTSSDKYWLQVELVCMFVKRGDTQPANSFSTTALKMCNCGLKVKLKIFIILHPSDVWQADRAGLSFSLQILWAGEIFGHGTGGVRTAPGTCLSHLHCLWNNN